MRSKVLNTFICFLLIGNFSVAQWTREYEFSHQEPVYKFYENNGYTFTQNRFTFNRESTFGPKWETIFRYGYLFVDAVSILNPMQIVIKAQNLTNHHIALCFTTDGGVSWQIDSLTFNDPKYSVICGIMHFGPDTLIMASAVGLFYVSVNGGATIDSIYIQGGPYQTSFIYNFVKLNSRSVFFYSSSAEGYRLFLTEDRGMSWRHLYTFPNHVINFQRVADSLIYAVGLNGMFYISRDEGRSWQSSQIAKGRNLVNLHFVDKDTGFVGGGEANLPPLYGFIYRTYDGGKTWEDVTPSDCRYQINALYFYDGKSGMAFSNYGETYYTSEGGGTGREVTDLETQTFEYPNSEYKLQLYPNPASETLHVSWNFITPNGGLLQIFTMQGQFLTVQPMSPSGNTDIDVSSLAAGMYLMRHTTPDGEGVKRFVVGR
jgi:photosystem II stability/assembly factor-like uncharacterized protein